MQAKILDEFNSLLNESNEFKSLLDIHFNKVQPLYKITNEIIFIKCNVIKHIFFTTTVPVIDTNKDDFSMEECTTILEYIMKANTHGIRLKITIEGNGNFFNVECL